MKWKEKLNPFIPLCDKLPFPLALAKKKKKTQEVKLLEAGRKDHRLIKRLRKPTTLKVRVKWY